MTLIDASELRKAVADLIRIDQARRMAELRENVAARNRESATGPRDLDHSPIGTRLQAQEIAKVASGLLGVPVDVCLAAAAEVLLPTKQQDVLAEIARITRELDGTTASKPTEQGVPAAIARAREGRL